MAENMQGGLWFTAMGRIVLDDHGGEVFCEDGDKKLLTKEELSHGVPVGEFQKRLIDELLRRGKK